MAEMRMNLHLFEGGTGGGAGGAAGAGAGAAPAAGAGEGGTAAAVTPGTLNDGTKVDNRLAARMEEQARKRRARGEEPIPVAAPAAEAPEAGTEETPQPVEEPAEPSLEDQWAEAKKGKYRELFGRDVQAAIQDRFKNQKDANETLAKLEPALQALARQRGIDANDLDALTENILNDDSLFEEEAERMGMTVEGARDYLAMEAENKRLKEQEAQQQEEIFLRQHFENLARQAEELRKTIPDFDLMREIRENETFRRLTMPNSGCTVEAAYYAVHHKDMQAQAMAYGIQRSQQQISQTLQANRQRPVEGAMTRGQPADIAVDPRTMTREERQRLIERARRGEKIII